MNCLTEQRAGIDIATHRTNHSGWADMPNAQIIMSNFVEAIETY